MVTRSRSRSRTALSLLTVVTLATGLLAQVPEDVQAAGVQAVREQAASERTAHDQPGSRDDLTLPDGYVDRVNHALDQGTDHWGEKLLGLPDGPTMANVKPLLVPANHGGTTDAASPWYYLPFTYPAPDPSRWAEKRDFSLHVADGSELMSQWSDSRATQRVRFFVGADGAERYGQAEARSGAPRLTGGYLPILANSYRDAAGARYERESFVTELTPGGPAVSMLRFVVSGPAKAHPRLRLNLSRNKVADVVAKPGRLTLDGKTVVAYSGAATWSATDLSFTPDLSRGKAEFYLVVPNEPAELTAVRPSAELYAAAKSRTGDYWTAQLNAGAKVRIPERYAADAMRSTLLNNLVMGFNLTVGNGYESLDKSFAFVPEIAATVTSLGDFGYQDKARANLTEMLLRGQGSFFLSWERGIKLQTVATYYLQSNDGSLLQENLPTFRDWLADFKRQRLADPNGLLAKTRYASDIPEPVYGLHHQSEVWRGLRDVGVALRLMGRADEAKLFLDEATGLRSSLLGAVEKSKTVLPDGSVFVPIALLDPASSKPYDKVTTDYLGSYWNLIMPYALATGLFEPGSATATGLRDYLYKHGSLLLGLTRFNLSTADPGVCQNIRHNQWPAIAGYKSSGIDQQYGYSLMRFLADNAESDRLDLSFYGMLAHNFTPNTFVGGEGATISPCPQFGEYYRSQYWPPLSPNNATYLEAVRGLLVSEDLDADGVPTRLHLAPATPRPWLADGERIEVADLPTSFGTVGFASSSELKHGRLTVRVDPPRAVAGRAPLTNVVLHLRVPRGHRLTGVTVDGRPVTYDAARELVDLGRPTTAVTVRATYRATKVADVPSAEATKVTTPRPLVEPGETFALDLEVEALGQRTVNGTVEVGAPAGWTVRQSKLPFRVSSNQRLAWSDLATSVRVPTDAAPGSYRIDVVTRPSGGTARTTSLSVRVARPDPADYAALVKRDAPVGYWRLDDAQGQPVVDASGNGNTGAYRGSVGRSQPGAIADSADTAVRLDDGYAEIPDSASLSITGAYTLEAWVKDAAGGPQGIVEKYDGGDCLPSRNGYALRLVNGNKLQALTVADHEQSGASSPRSVQQVRWQHVAATYDGTTLRTYIDGQLQTSTPVAKAPTDGKGSLKLGARGDDGADRFFGGLDEVAIYDKALTPGQIDSHYVKGVLGNPGPSSSAQQSGGSSVQSSSSPAPAGSAPGQTSTGRQSAVTGQSSYAAQVLADKPVGYWRLGEESGTSAEDSSGTGNRGAYTDAVTLGRPGALTGDPDTAAELTGGHIAVPDSASVSVSGSFTLEAWVNLNDVCGQYSVVEKYDAPAYNGYVLRVLPGGRINALTLGGAGQLASVEGQTVVTPDTWHHVAAVYDGSTITVYLDGRLDGSAATKVNPTDGAGSLKLGARGDDAGTRLAGLLDEVAVYDHALTADEVKRHYSVGTTG
ncbi:NEW3 domain-containing protein [Micromonospora sp. NBC_01655]|uniref:LamG-like jellyroll fold domain-containing protein n=1 Tax=Micromonospora sp. NBC_01655 TaxID=2975983 RepID=UPI0022515825|nr:LamG-like jellyroll fold domain-containing protein [Micromonospora sp. NBC_01655]MCX4471599.1 NEW3 domain-containing protein [Micromonospora sp. NBC_01655]